MLLCASSQSQEAEENLQDRVRVNRGLLLHPHLRKGLASRLGVADRGCRIYDGRVPHQCGGVHRSEMTRQFLCFRGLVF